MLPWVPVRVHDLTGDDLGMALVPMPIELGDEITVEAHPWPLEVVNLVWTPSGAKIAAIVEVRPVVLHRPRGRLRRALVAPERFA